MNIWVPKVKILEPREALSSVSRVGGRFRLRVLDAQSRGVKQETNWFPNLVLNQGLDLMASVSSWLNVCRVGSDGTAPAVGDTDLGSSISTGTSNIITTVDTNSGAPSYYASTVRTYEFAVGAIVGTVAEVGIGTSTAVGNNLFSRALVLDGGGSPTTISVGALDILQVTYECRQYPPLIDATGNVTLNAIVYGWTCRAANVGSGTWSSPFVQTRGNTTTYSGPNALAAVTSQPTGLISGGATNDGAAYVNGNYWREFTSSFTTSQGNHIGGMQTYRKITGGQDLQVGFSPAIPKTASSTLSLTFRNTWTRVTIP